MLKSRSDAAVGRVDIGKPWWRYPGEEVILIERGGYSGGRDRLIYQCGDIALAKGAKSVYDCGSDDSGSLAA